MGELRVLRGTFEALGLKFWGSDCDRCGNATPGSMTCDSCKCSDQTRALWLEEGDRG